VIAIGGTWARTNQSANGSRLLKYQARTRALSMRDPFTSVALP
jgi:hypothetical protein